MWSIIKRFAQVFARRHKHRSTSYLIMRRNRGRLTAAVALGSAGTCAVYYAYNRWDELKQARIALWEWHARQMQIAGIRRPDAKQASPEEDAELQAAADEHLAAHFASVQHISADVTTPSLLPMLADSLNRVTNYKPLLEMLRRGEVTGTAKVAAWEDIKVLTFTRAALATWMIALLHLMTRVQLNILGRHIYWQNNNGGSRHPQHSSAGAAAAWSASGTKGAAISNRAQELFLAYTHFCGECGVEPLVPIVREAVSRAVGSIELTEALDADRVVRIFSEIHLAVEPTLMTAGFEQFVLPSPEQRSRWHSAARMPEVLCLQRDAPPVLDDNVLIEALVGEVRQVVTSPGFAAAVQAAVREAAKQAADELGNSLGPGTRPLAKLCSRVAELAGWLLQREDNRCLPRLADLPEVKKLSAAVYSCGPPL